MPSEELVSTSLQSLRPHHLVVRDMSDGCGAKFDVLIVSDEFEGKRVLERHRIVNDALKELMPEIHALTISALTVQKWKERNQ